MSEEGKLMYQIRGYDKVLSEMYTLPHLYNTKEEARQCCKSNEHVVKV